MLADAIITFFGGCVFLMIWVTLSMLMVLAGHHWMLNHIDYGVICSVVVWYIGYNYVSKEEKENEE